MANAPFSLELPDAAERFDRLALEWEEETRFLSSVHQIAMNRAYQQIIALGPVAVPLILRRMTETPGHWFWALQAITGEDPVQVEHAGDVRAMTADWLRWAGSRRLLSS